MIRTALIAGALLAFALSFDELTSRAPWADRCGSLRSLSRPNNAPIVNAVAVFAILLSILPVYVAQRLAGADTASVR